ncbi:MAG TPA: hypothetical protein EYP60_06900 [bacterium (Candidatus Stahlbacteria)]|nr:hypothetical protein [Candidatus Stahlbacteria bacterium]
MMKNSKKMQIEVLGGEKQGLLFYLPFNPNEYTEKLTNSYKDQELIGFNNFKEQFTTAQVGELNLNLLFDTSSKGTDVRDELKNLAFISKIDRDLHIPPPCRFIWGSLLFQGVISQYSRNFTYFYSDGIPARARVTLNIKPHKSQEESARENETHSSDVTKYHQLKEGESLFYLAQKHYKDPNMWRKIARANGVDDPLSIPFGTAIMISPKDN